MTTSSQCSVPFYSEARLDLLTSAGEEKTVRLVCEVEYLAVLPQTTRPGLIIEIEPRIMYLDLDRVEYDQCEVAIPTA